MTTTKSQRLLRGTIEFVHSLTAGIFPGAVLGMWIIWASVPRTHLQTVQDVSKAAPALWLVLLGALFLLVMTGLARIGYYESLVIPENLPTKRRTVLIKHALFITIVALCIVLMFRVVPA